MMLTRTSALFTLLLPGLVLGVAGCKGDESQPIGAGGNASGALSGAGGEGMAGDSGMGGANDPALPRHGSTVVLDASALVEDTSAAVDGRHSGAAGSRTGR
jgi:hypothetical protein